ncbi:hypothetical protein PybrP1_012174 [[Pythium] brassicae (nom. inval.)]|nr:hypothetical protein PybrP1_012174 [[Pythium] brassicae (nom. inval.)]
MQLHEFHASGGCPHPLSPVLLPRAQWPLGRVLTAAERLVLLGFSADGHFLLYYACGEAALELQWKAVDFAAQRASELPTLRLRVGPQHDRSLDASQAALRVWQSADHALVVAFASAPDGRQLLVEGASQSVHVSLTASPSRCGAASDVAGLHFVFSAPQQPALWQLVRLFPRQWANAHHLLLSTGATVHVLVFAIVETRGASQSDGVAAASAGGGADSSAFCWRGQLGVHRFAENAWYAAPEFPVEFQRETLRRHPQFDSDGSASVAVECICQHTFDVEAFVHAFLRKYPATRTLHLVDYDLQLVRASAVERALFMSCVLELDASALSNRHQQQQPPPQQNRRTMALLFSLDIPTGECAVIRALQQPQQRHLRQLSRSLANAFRAAIDSLVPPPEGDAAASEWSNAAVMREQSLRRVDNPRFPVTIVSA